MAPTVVVSTHKPSIERSSPFKMGYCLAQRHLGQMPAWCEEFRNATDLHLFRTITGPPSIAVPPKGGWCQMDWARETGRPPHYCRNLSEHHYRTVAGHQRKDALFDFNMERVSAVEKIAKQMNVTCPSLMKPPLWY